MAHTLFSHRWHRTQNALIQQQLDAAIAPENQPLPEQLPNYTQIVHTACINGDLIWSLQPLLSQTRNRSGQTLTEEITQ